MMIKKTHQLIGVSFFYKYSMTRSILSATRHIRRSSSVGPVRSGTMTTFTPALYACVPARTICTRQSVLLSSTGL